MSTEPNTGLTWQEANSQTTDALHNQVVDLLAVWLNCTVLAVGQAVPAGSEVEGDRYIVGTGTGVFAGHDDELAILRGGTWQFHAPPAAGVPIIKNLDDGADWQCNDAGVWSQKAGTGTSAGRHMIPVMAAGMSPKQAAGCAALAYFAGASGQPDVPFLAFDPSTEEHAQFAIPMPKSWNEGTVTFKPIWKHTATATNFGVCWKLRALAVSDDDTLVASFGTEQSSVDTGGTTNDHYVGPESSAITIAGSPATEDLVMFDLYRDPADAGDTLAVDAQLLGIRLYYTTDAETDA